MNVVSTLITFAKTFTKKSEQKKNNNRLIFIRKLICWSFNGTSGIKNLFLEQAFIQLDRDFLSVKFYKDYAFLIVNYLRNNIFHSVIWSLTFQRKSDECYQTETQWTIYFNVVKIDNSMKKKKYWRQHSCQSFFFLYHIHIFSILLLPTRWTVEVIQWFFHWTKKKNAHLAYLSH